MVVRITVLRARCAALGLDRLARPSKQERPCRQCTLVTLKYRETREEIERLLKEDPTLY